jgi:hypothetical protein
MNIPIASHFAAFVVFGQVQTASVKFASISARQPGAAKENREIA